MQTLIDNDILMKGACYCLLADFLSSELGEFGVLGAARFVVAKAIRNSGLQGDPESAIGRLNDFLNGSVIVEPTDEEQNLAADFELQAQQAGVALDAGESQLCAVFVVRALQWLLTGDKRAIEALEELLDDDARLQALKGRVLCLEQLILRHTSNENFSSVRDAICSEPDLDKALSISFSCKTSTTIEGALEGLNSYINDLHRNAPRILAN